MSVLSAPAPPAATAGSSCRVHAAALPTSGPAMNASFRVAAPVRQTRLRLGSLMFEGGSRLIRTKECRTAMGILIIADEAVSSVLDVAQKFEPLARDIALKHGGVAQLNYVPLDNLTWGYQSSDETALMMRCQVGDEPADKGAVSAFFGEFTIARQADEKLVGVLVSIGGFTANGLNSAQAFCENIRRTSQGSNFFYDSDDVLDIASGHRKTLPVQDLVTRVERAVGAPPVSFDLVLTSVATFWLVELDEATSGSFVLMSPMGDRVDRRGDRGAADAASVRGATATISGRHRQSAVHGQVGNGRRAQQCPLQPPAGGLLERTESDRRTRQQAEALVSAGRTRLCPERGDSICQEFERNDIDVFQPHRSASDRRSRCGTRPGRRTSGAGGRRHRGRPARGTASCLGMGSSNGAQGCRQTQRRAAACPLRELQRRVDQSGSGPDRSGGQRDPVT